MSYNVRITKNADNDLWPLYAFLCERDPLAADKACAAIESSLRLLEAFPFTCRKVSPDKPFLRELVTDFDHAGYVALFEIRDDQIVAILAVRYQREADHFS